ncbi:unnamed protein product [Schistosoma turkestanicum]|nr:unnamed protein product [Schistosoma turkestanicum]
MVLSGFSRTFSDISSGDGSLSRSLQDNNQNCSINRAFGISRSKPNSKTPTRTPSRSGLTSDDSVNKKTPNSSIKKMLTVHECDGDRFIPNRSSTNMCRARHAIRKCNEDSSNEEAAEYQQAVAASLNTNDCPGSRILRYNAATRDNGNTHCAANSSVSTVKGPYKRAIPQMPEKVLDAPDIIDDFYLNILDWSVDNILAVALNQEVYLWNSSSGDITCLMSCGLEDEYVSSLKWSPDSPNIIAVGLSAGRVQLWDISSQSLVRTMRLGGVSSAGRISAVTWREYLVSSASKSGHVRHHDTRIAHHEVGVGDFHTQRVDCVIDGTGLSESLISASLSILGKRILHIDRNDYYGGVLASLRFPEFEKLLNQAELDFPKSLPAIKDRCLDLSGIRSPLVTHRSSDWFLGDSCDKSLDANNDIDAGNSGNVSKQVIHDSPRTTALPSDSTVQYDSISTEISSVIHQPGEEHEESAGNEHENVVIPTERKSDGDKIVQCQKLWSRSKLRNAIRLHDIDIVPKILYSHSPVVTALQRADVTRYLEFRFVSRLLAYINDNQSTQQSETDSSNVNHQSSTTNCHGHVVKIPVCRSDVFKTRLLSLHQKRSLGAFFEWCFHLIINDTQRSTTHTEKDEDYCAYEDRPFQDLLTEKRKLDKFTQQLIITNLSFSKQQIKTKDAIFRIRRLLFSMGRFGPYPILWPMYGSGDLTQGYCRMSAVFGATFCLGCKVEKIEHVNSEVNGLIQSIENISIDMKEGLTTTTETDLSSSSSSVSLRNNNTDDNDNNNNDNDDFIVYLSNGKQIRTKCVILCPECLPYSWISDYINQWCARAVLITDSSLLPDDCNSSDISILAYQQNDAHLDPIIIIECQVEKNKFCENDLFVVHLCAIIKQPDDPKKIFQSVLNCLFTPYADKDDDTACSQSVDQSQCKRPRMLWAGYFCVPDLSSIPHNFSTLAKSETFMSSNIFVTSGPDASPDLDSIIPNAEEIFHNVISILGLPNNSTMDTIKQDDNTSQTEKSTTSYTTIDATWDGQFPPKAPRPEDIIVVDESMNSPPTVTIEPPQEDQN